MAATPEDVRKEAQPLPDKDLDGADVESSAEGEGAIMADTARVQDHEAERRLCRKFDIRILPVLAVMCEYLGERKAEKKKVNKTRSSH